MEKNQIEKISTGVFGIIAGIALTTLIGFKVFGWKTADSVAEELNEALQPLAAQICVGNFKSDPAFDANLVEMTKVSDWRRDGYISEGTWAIMEGDDSPMNGVALACAKKLNLLVEKH